MMRIRQWLNIPQHKYSASVIFKWLWQAWHGNRLQAFLNVGIGMLSVAISLLQVWAVQRAIDVAAGDRVGSIKLSVGLIGLFILSRFMVNIASVWVRNILGVKAQNRMQQQMLDRILRSEWLGNKSRHSGDVVNRLEIDVTTVVNFLTETIPGSISVFTMFIGAFFYLFSMDKVLALIIIAIVPFFAVLSKLYVGQMRRLTRQVRDSDSKVQSVLQETLQHRMLIKSLESDDTMIDRLESTQSELRSRVVKRTAFSVVSNLILNLGFAIGYLTAFLWAALRLSEKTLTFGGMTAFLQLVGKIQGPARELTKLVPAFVSVFTAAERLMELEETPLEEQGSPMVMSSPCGVKLSHVSYAYDEGQQVLRDLSFDFYPGSCTAVMGETGTGKTTLIRLLLSLIHPNQGSLSLYNENKCVAISPLTRYNFVYVPQGNTLMSGTIRDNLRLGKLNASNEEMIAALEKSCASFVLDLPDGLDTVCGEVGSGLSEGQAQRISIARALLRDRSVMLFDESTSALDIETERKLLHNILASKDKTVIFITHRKAVVNYCDQVLTIQK